LDLLWGIRRKSDFERAKGGFWRKAAIDLAVTDARPSSNFTFKALTRPGTGAIRRMNSIKTAG
jgi:hypothetical protein